MIFRKIVTFTIVLSFLLLSSSLIFQNVKSQESPWWDDNWSFRQEIKIPIDTSNPHSIFQPLDLRIVFENPCWGKDTVVHSIRVAAWDGKTWTEIESQIYDITEENNIIGECSLVFLIPKTADGSEKYYAYYNDKETSPPDYTDHVSISLDHYFYEPIPGQSVNLDYYKILDEQNCVYGVGIKGKMMTEYASNLIFSQKSGNKDFDIKTWEHMTSFCFQYDNKEGDVFTTRYNVVSNEVFVDGNLMVYFGIVSENKAKSAKTTNFYKYYYIPSGSMRICVDTKSEISKEIRIDQDVERDGTYVFLSQFKTRSETNTGLNIGEILPYYHVYNEEGQIREYNVDTNPTAREEHKIIAVKDDIDLGDNSWFSCDEGKSGKTHAIVLNSNKEISSLERDGMQVKAYEKEEASLPGLKAYSAGVYSGRNSYEKGENWDLSIPSDLTVEFRGELFKTDTSGYMVVDDEAALFKDLVEVRPIFGGTVKEREDIELFSLSVHVPFSISLPLISTVSPIPLQITWVQLYQNNSLISEGATSRSLTGMKIDFEGISKGEYLIKVYKNHGQRIRFVSFIKKVVDKNDRVWIFPGREIKLTASIKDQEGNDLQDVRLELVSDNLVVANNITDENGELLIKTPAFRSYVLRGIYKNLVVFEKDLPLLFSKKISENVGLYDLRIIVEDKLGLAPGIDLNPVVTSSKMISPIYLSFNEKFGNEFAFSKLPSASYDVIVSYEDFTDEKQVDLNDDETFEVSFTAEFPLHLKLFDDHSNDLNSGIIVLERSGVEFSKTIGEDGEVSVNLPPGNYMLTVYDEEEIQNTRIDVIREKSVYLVTNKEFSLPLIILIMSVIIIIVSISLFFFKKIRISACLKFIAIALVLVALMNPWWELQGSSDEYNIERNSKSYLIPQTIITVTSHDEYVEAEPANIPAEFSYFLLGLVFVSITSCIMLFVSIFIMNHKKVCLFLVLLGFLLLVLSIVVFSYAFSELTNVGLGSLQGSDSLNILIPGSDMYIDIQGSWGFSKGVFILIAAIFVTLLALIFDKK